VDEAQLKRLSLFDERGWRDGLLATGGGVDGLAEKVAAGAVELVRASVRELFAQTRCSWSNGVRCHAH